MTDYSNGHIVMAGNPGTGKSSILNSVIGAITFHSGIALAKGLTYQLDERTIGGVTYSDTPGLDDVEMRQKAADEISKLLRKGGLFKLVFVITLEAGRIKPADKATINIILQAIKDIDVQPDYFYSIIVNKCDQGVLAALQNDLPARAKLEAALGVGKSLKSEHIGYMPFVPEASGKDDYLLQGHKNYRIFIDKAPVLKLPLENEAKVNVMDWNDIIQRLEKELAEVRKQLEKALRQQELLPVTKNYASRPFSRFCRGVKDGICSILDEFFDGAGDMFTFYDEQASTES